MNIQINNKTLAFEACLKLKFEKQRFISPSAIYMSATLTPYSTFSSNDFVPLPFTTPFPFSIVVELFAHPFIDGFLVPKAMFFKFITGISIVIVVMSVIKPMRKISLRFICLKKSEMVRRREVEKVP